MATPRDLDPKFRTEAVKPKEIQPEVTESENDSDTPMIVHKERVVDSAGNIVDKLHGPMPVSEWSNYEKENNL